LLEFGRQRPLARVLSTGFVPVDVGLGPVSLFDNSEGLHLASYCPRKRVVTLLVVCRIRIGVARTSD
jgi:hypothetical protein